MAEVKPSYDNSRTNLADVIPLSGPYSIYVEATRLCNFKCFYCMHATRGQAGGVLEKTGFKIANIEQALFDKFVAVILHFHEQPKRITFSGLGDPLMNKQLPDLIRQLRDSGYLGRIDVITNAALLTRETSDALISAGISRLQVSVQGLSAERYLEVCGVEVNIERLIENIKYFYNKRGNAQIFVKIIDSLLRDSNEDSEFFKMFSPICDTIFVEHLVIMQGAMGDHGGKTDKSRNLNGEYVEPRDVCGVMFYFLQLNIDGDLFPCSTPGLSKGLSMGSLHDDSLLNIWNGARRNNMLIQNLRESYRSFPECVDCSSVICIAGSDEYLDDKRNELLLRLTPEMK